MINGTRGKTGTGSGGGLRDRACTESGVVAEADRACGGRNGLLDRVIGLIGAIETKCPGGNSNIAVISAFKVGISLKRTLLVSVD